MFRMLPLVIIVVFAMLYLIDLLTNVRALVEVRLARRRLARRASAGHGRAALPIDGAISLDVLLQELHAA